MDEKKPGTLSRVFSVRLKRLIQPQALLACDA